MVIALYTHVDMLGHQPGARHPECPERLAVVSRALGEADDLDLDRHDAPLAGADDLTLAHSPRFVEAMFAAAPAVGHHTIDADTRLSPGSLDAARRAAGAVAAAARAVARGESERAFCAVRPPGHHAEPGRAMGFCVFSNVAIGALAARQAGMDRVAVVDFDVHHGNGTQAVFERDPSLFFASVHQSPCYPGTGDPGETGEGNIANAVVAPGAPRETWRAAFESLMVRLDAFSPDMILISAGFDAHAQDPLAEQSLEAEDFAWATRAVASVARSRCAGRIVSSLEGGYNLDALGRSALAHVRALHAA